MSKVKEVSTTEKKKVMTKSFIGIVESVKMNKTVVVSVLHLQRHPLYQKMMRRTRRFLAHNEDTTIKVGDRVQITETRPMSKLKHFLLTGRVEA